MSGVTVVGSDNFFESFNLEGPEAGGDLLLENLRTDDLTLRWASPARTTGSTWFRGYTTSPADLRWFALIDHDLDTRLTAGFGKVVSPQAQWRVRTVSSDFRFHALPYQVTNLSGLTGSIAAFAEFDPQLIDGTSLAATSDSVATSARIWWAYPPAKLSDVADSQSIRVNVSMRGTGSFPSVTMILAQSGVDRLTICPSTPIGVPKTSGGQIITGTFKLSNLSGTAPIEIRVVATPTATSTVEINAAIWDIEIVGDAGYDYYDSGRLNIVLPPWYRTRGLSVLNAIHQAPRTVSAGTVQIDLFDEANSRFRVSMGKALASNALSVSMARSSWRFGWTDPSIAIALRGGNEKFIRKRKRRRVNVQIPPGALAEALDLFDRIERNYGSTYSLLWVFDDAHPENWVHTAVFGRCPDLSEFSNDTNFFLKPLSVLETL
jgi:hypothetical protein